MQNQSQYTQCLVSMICFHGKTCWGTSIRLCSTKCVGIVANTPFQRATYLVVKTTCLACSPSILQKATVPAGCLSKAIPLSVDHTCGPPVGYIACQQSTKQYPPRISLQRCVSGHFLSKCVKVHKSIFCVKPKFQKVKGNLLIMVRITSVRQPLVISLPRQCELLLGQYELLPGNYELLPGQYKLLSGQYKQTPEHQKKSFCVITFEYIWFMSY